MRDPLTLVLALLFLVLIGEGVLWAKRHDKEIPRWKVRGMLWVVGLMVVAYEFVKPVQGVRLGLILYSISLVLIVLLGGLFFFASRVIRGVNQALVHAQQLHGVGKTAEAIAVLDGSRRKAARLDQNTESIVLAEMARLSMEMNDLEAADRYLAEAEKLSALNQGVYAVRADLFTRAGDHRAACDALRRGIEKLPNSVWLNTVLAERLADAGQEDECRQVLARTIELMDGEKVVDVADPVEWQELRIRPLLKRIGLTPGRLVTDAD